MTKKGVQLFSSAAMLLLILCVVGLARFTSASEETAKPNIFTADAALKDLPNYRQWTRVNQKPKIVFDLSSDGG